MIRTLTITKDMKLKSNVPVELLSQEEVSWFWVDFEKPCESELALLSKYFHFHPLAIEDCLQTLQRPKLDYYEGYNFFTFNALNQKNLEAEEIGIFVGNNYIVSIHINWLSEIDECWQKVISSESSWDRGPTFVMYSIMDKIVDQYFPAIYKIEDHLDKLDNNVKGKSVRILMNEVFDIRGDLLELRRTVNSMRDLLYRVLNSERLNGFKEYRLYFSDIYDHLLKLSDMIESNRDITSDMRDSYLSISSNRMNTNMMMLTVISTIFMPLTFIAGVYGMNFDFMPELRWEYGYFIIVGIMVTIGVAMFFWFKRKGWFNL